MEGLLMEGILGVLFSFLFVTSVHHFYRHLIAVTMFRLSFSREPFTKHRLLKSFPSQWKELYSRIQSAISFLKISIALRYKMSATKIGLLFWWSWKSCLIHTKKTWFTITKRRASKCQEPTTQLPHRATFLKFSTCLSMVLSFGCI